MSSMIPIMVEFSVPDKLLKSAFDSNDKARFAERVKRLLQMPELVVDHFLIPLPRWTRGSWGLASSVPQGHYLGRGQATEDMIEEIGKAAAVKGIYVDPPLTSTRDLDHVEDPERQGSLEDLQERIAAGTLSGRGLNGEGVRVAIVDQGISRNKLARLNVNPGYYEDSPRLMSAGRTKPFQFENWPHGTMSAFDVCISAPRCTLIDVPLLEQKHRRRITHPETGGNLAHMLSEAIHAYQQLAAIATLEPGPLVVCNAWDVDPEDDMPASSPLNYGSNPKHPFNRAVADLSALGADILFSSGKNAADSATIIGANAHPEVLTVTSVGLNRTWTPLNPLGPGLLKQISRKPDIAGYAGFKGSYLEKLYDAGPSAACAVVAGIIAAIRTKYPVDPQRPETLPDGLREAIRNTAIDLPEAKGDGWDVKHGWGVIDVPKLLARLGLAP